MYLRKEGELQNQQKYPKHPRVWIHEYHKKHFLSFKPLFFKPLPDILFTIQQLPISVTQLIMQYPHAICKSLVEYSIKHYYCNRMLDVFVEIEAPTLVKLLRRKLFQNENIFTSLSHLTVLFFYRVR